MDSALACLVGKEHCFNNSFEGSIPVISQSKTLADKPVPHPTSNNLVFLSTFRCFAIIFNLFNCSSSCNSLYPSAISS
jgi:hypothetical protein